MRIRIAVVVACLAAGLSLVSAAAANPLGVFPAAGRWVAFNKHGHHKQKFKVTSDHKHVTAFVLHIPYTCALSTPPGIITVHSPKKVKVNSYNGYFHVGGSNVTISGFTTDLDWSFNGFFSDKGRLAKLAKGQIGVDFDTTGGDLCNDRFDSWKGGLAG